MPTTTHQQAMLGIGFLLRGESCFFVRNGVKSPVENVCFVKPIQTILSFDFFLYLWSGMVIQISN